MKNIATFVLLLVSGASCRDVNMKRELMDNTTIDHWLRAATPSDECAKKKGVIGVVGIVGIVAAGEITIPVGTGVDLTRNAKVNKGNQVPDPDDCERFYICLDEGKASDNSYACSDYGSDYLCFDPEKGECSDDAFVCDSVCGTNPHNCQTKCNAHTLVVADVKHCHRFFVCRDDPTIPGEFVKDVHTCDSEYPYFNGVHCVKDESKCCKCQKDVCLQRGDRVADPEDCHSYYFCELFGVNLKPVGPHRCEGTGSFINGACDGPAHCEARCDLGGGGETTTTTTTTTTRNPIIPTITPRPINPVCKDINTYICPGKGNYPKCSNCDPFFFECGGIGHKPTLRSCSLTPWDLSPGVLKVFHPKYCYCVENVVCPVPTYLDQTPAPGL